MGEEVHLHRLVGRKKAQEACRLVERLFDGGQRVVVWISDDGKAALFDDYLWTFAQYAFVPHSRWSGPGVHADPVVIVSGTLVNPNGAGALVVVDRLADLDRARSFDEIHDFDAGGDEDAGKAAAWQAAGFTIRKPAPHRPPPSG